MLRLLCLLAAGWVLVWLDMPVLGTALLALFAWQSWRRALRSSSSGASGTGHATNFIRANRSSFGPWSWKWRSEPLSPALFTAYPPHEERTIGGIFEAGNMGGPRYWRQLLRDGALLEEVCSQVLDLDDGRLRLAEKCRRSGNPQLQVYDCENHLVHLLPVDCLEADFFSAIARNPSPELIATVRQACQHSEHTEALHQVHGIWVPRQQPPPKPVLLHKLRNDMLLEARLMLPNDVSRAADPHSLLSLAPYALFLDGVDTGRHVTHLLTVNESPDGQAFCLPGLRLSGGRGEDGLWHLWQAGQWHTVRSYATKAAGAQGADHLFELDVFPQDDGVFHATLQDCVFGLNGQEDAGTPAPSEIELPASWSKYSLRLATHNNTVQFQAPPYRA